MYNGRIMNQSSTTFITGLRGYAALAVLITHIGTPFATWLPIFDRYKEIGNYGVVSFFIISAFTLFMSFGKENSIGIKKYIKKRFFRIAPLYYLVILFGFLTASSPWKNPSTPHYDIADLLFHFFFLNLGEINYLYQNSLAGVEWSIAIETFYYLILPFLFIAVKKRMQIILLLIVGLFLFFNHELYRFYMNPKNPVGFQWSLQKYFLIYVLGSLGYLLLYERVKRNYRASIISLVIFMFTGVIIFFVGLPEGIYFLILSLLFLYILFIKNPLINYVTNSHFLLRSFIIESDLMLLICLLIMYASHKFTDPTLFVAAWTIVVISSCSYRGKLSKLIYENKFVIYLGIVSYSFYLLQFFIIDTLNKYLPAAKPSNYSFRWFCVFIILLIASSITYYIVEKPFIDYANGKNKKLEYALTYVKNTLFVKRLT